MAYLTQGREEPLVCGRFKSGSATDAFLNKLFPACTQPIRARAIAPKANDIPSVYRIVYRTLQHLG